MVIEPEQWGADVARELVEVRTAVRNFVAQLIVKNEGGPAVTIVEQTIQTSVFAALLNVTVPLTPGE